MKPNIILWDLEVLADMDKVREVFFQVGDYPGRTLKASINSVICFGYMRLDEKKAHCISAWDFKGWKTGINDDRELMIEARKVLETADGIVTHNGKRFDLKFFNSRLVYHGLSPLPPIPHVDTCQVAKRLFLFSNSLKYLAKFLKCKSQKIETGGQDLWTRVSRREPSALKAMSAYCVGDVLTLKDVLVRLMSLTKDLPNYTYFQEGAEACPRCGGKQMQKRGFSITRAGSIQRYQCQSCGGYSGKSKRAVMGPI